MKKGPAKAWSRLLLGLAAGLVGLALWASGNLAGWENVTWDWRVRLLAGPSPATPDLALIVLDQASLDWAQKELSLSWPWPRQVYVPLVESAGTGGARTFSLDVIFTEPSPLQGDDALLGESFKKGLPVIAPVVLGSSSGGVPAWPGELLPKLPRIEGVSEWLPSADGKAGAKKALLPIPEVSGNASALGNVGELPDEDQVVRRVSLVRIFDGRAVPSLALAAYLTATGLEARLEPGGLIIGERSVPLDSSGRAVLNYRGGPGTHAKYSAAGVIQAHLLAQEGKKTDLDQAAFKGKHLFFGFTAPGLHDLRASPLSPVHPGVEIQATVLDNLLNNDFIRPAPGAAVGLVILVLGLLSGWSVAGAKRSRQVILALALFIPLPIVAGLAAYRLGAWFPMVGPEAATLLGLMAGVYFNYITEGRQRRFIKTAFKHYLSPQVIDQIVQHPENLKLGGQRRELSILFSDLEGFTTISEGLDPTELTQLLNDYLSDMTEIILDEGGTLDKYEGDAIIAFWNAPLDQPDHPKRAVRASLRCQAKLEERRAEFQERTGAVLKARIGLHTGPVVVGNLGSHRRFDYTVLGDAANLASRLEGANKVFGTYLMVSEATWSQLDGEFRGRELGRIRVVGRKTPVRVYEPLGPAQETDSTLPEAMAQGLELCRRGDWAKACQHFKGMGDDPAAQKYLARCLELKSDPKATWDVIWRLDKK